MKANKKPQKREQTDSKAIESSKHKSNGMKRLNELLIVVIQIKEELSTSNLKTSLQNSRVHFS